MTEPSRAEFKYLVERQREEIRTINEVGRILASSTDPLDLIRRLAAYLKQTFPAALVGVLLPDHKLLHLIPFANIAQIDLANAINDHYTTALQSLGLTIDETKIPAQMETNASIKAQDLQGPLVYLRSRYFAVLSAGERRMGLLSVSSGKPAAFGQDDQHVIDIVADQLSAALQNAYLLQELVKANQMKNDLLMVISHELRIPLTAIREGVNLLLEGALGEVNAEQKDFLNTVNDNAGRLDILVEKVVSATQLLTGQLKCTFKPMPIQSFVADLGASFKPLAAAKQVTLTIAIPVPDATVQADPKRLKQAIGNVLENAIQASPSGAEVTLHVAQTPTGVQFLVSDAGPGIAAEELPKLFEQFRVVGGVDDRKTGGLGLGLFLARTILQAHGGAIVLESEVGRGTRVRMDIPMQPPAPAKA